MSSSSRRSKVCAHHSPNSGYVTGAVLTFYSSRNSVNKNTQWLILDAGVVDSVVVVEATAVAVAVVRGEDPNGMTRRSGTPAASPANRQL